MVALFPCIKATFSVRKIRFVFTFLTDLLKKKKKREEDIGKKVYDAGDRFHNSFLKMCQIGNLDV